MSLRKWVSMGAPRAIHSRTTSLLWSTFICDWERIGRLCWSIKNARETRIPGDGDTQVTRRKKSKGRGQPHCEPQPHQEQQPTGSSLPNKREIPPKAQKSHESQPQQEQQPQPKKRGRPPGSKNKPKAASEVPWNWNLCMLMKLPMHLMFWLTSKTFRMHFLLEIPRDRPLI